MMIIREYQQADLNQMVEIWNNIVREGIAFPQEDILDLNSGAAFFASQTRSGVAVDQDNEQIAGLYILHPNHIGRCGHICNASYAVNTQYRGQKIGRALVLDSLKEAKKYGFRIMQFNAVVESNSRARYLYESLGFHQIGVIPGGFRMKDGSYANICPYYYDLTRNEI